MIPLDDAWAHVREAVPPLPVATVPVADALGLVLAEPVVAATAVPPFDNSAVDGVAVRCADVAGPGAELPVVGEVAAGSVAQRPLEPGCAVRIMTGAPVPEGADAVVMVEDTEVVRAADGAEVVRVAVVPEPRRHIRPAGDDIRPGDTVLEPRVLLGEAHLGLLATLGREQVDVVRRPVVGVLSTGDELVPPGRPLGPGQIHDSNRVTLLALCRAAGFEAVDLGLWGDDEAPLEEALRDAADRCDAVLTSGGVSMGDHDPVKAVLARIADMRWMQVAIRPAKPFAFGLLRSADRQVPVFGLPGNPVSSQVSFELFARPGIRVMGRHPRPHRRRVAARAGEDFGRRSDGKVHFVRVRLTQDDDLAFVATSAGGQGSHQLSGMAAADGLAVLPDGDGAAMDDRLEVLLLR
ncbi:MAG: gephyrin-like molybdotransferase Glp [Microthrixaceae bacterium]